MAKAGKCWPTGRFQTGRLCGWSSAELHGRVRMLVSAANASERALAQHALPRQLSALGVHVTSYRLAVMHALPTCIVAKLPTHCKPRVSTHPPTPPRFYSAPAHSAAMQQQSDSPRDRPPKKHRGGGRGRGRGGGAPTASPRPVDLPLPEGGIHIDGSMLEGGEEGSMTNRWTACVKEARGRQPWQPWQPGQHQHQSTRRACRRPNSAQCVCAGRHPGQPAQGR